MTKAAAPMMGGMICPPVDAAASTAPANLFEKPLRLIMGIVITPVPTTLATALPETDPNSPEAKTAACAGPPAVLRIIEKAMRIIDSPAPTPSSKAPRTMNGRTVERTMENVAPKMPVSRLYHRFCASSSCMSPVTKRIAPGQYSPVSR